MENNVAPFVGVLGSIIGWSFFLIALGMFKNFISHGFSIALAEFLFKHATPEIREKIARWFGNGDLILQQLQELDAKLRPDDVQ